VDIAALTHRKLMPLRRRRIFTQTFFSRFMKVRDMLQNQVTFDQVGTQTPGIRHILRDFDCARACKISQLAPGCRNSKRGCEGYTITVPA
jgi:hypothetical protein